MHLDPLQDSALQPPVLLRQATDLGDLPLLLLSQTLDSRLDARLQTPATSSSEPASSNQGSTREDLLGWGDAGDKMRCVGRPLRDRSH